MMDTPGISDSRGCDARNIGLMVSGMKEIGYLHTIGLVFNYESPRLDENLQDTLKLFAQMFGKEFLKNALLIFTHFSYS